MENHDRYFEIVWGCHYAGAVYTACSSRLTASELQYVVNDCEAKVFITSKYKADQAAEIVAGTPNVAVRLMLDGDDRRIRLATRRPSPPSRPNRSTRTASPAPTCSTRRARRVGRRA